ncbi:glycoprotein [Dar es Salaam virus TZ-189]|uniref:Envelopment polyprotein n=1 Tax=Dar es Salaam virus TZ-189 TaxID=2576944 RepID=A0A4Y6JJU9_9VIRU|nr:glycoprotein [Dar es Salaam virus TZ-189]QDF82061.1 glycoprotein [Dar es Salaam virus TZ-189]
MKIGLIGIIFLVGLVTGWRIPFHEPAHHLSGQQPIHETSILQDVRTKARTSTKTFDPRPAVPSSASPDKSNVITNPWTGSTMATNVVDMPLDPLGHWLREKEKEEIPKESEEKPRTNPAPTTHDPSATSILKPVTKQPSSEVDSHTTSTPQTSTSSDLPQSKESTAVTPTSLQPIHNPRHKRRDVNLTEYDWTSPGLSFNLVNQTSDDRLDALKILLAGLTSQGGDTDLAKSLQYAIDNLDSWTLPICSYDSSEQITAIEPKPCSTMKVYTLIEEDGTPCLQGFFCAGRTPSNLQPVLNTNFDCISPAKTTCPTNQTLVDSSMILLCQANSNTDVKPAELSDKSLCSISGVSFKDCASSHETDERLAVMIRGRQLDIITGYSVIFMDKTSTISDYKCTGDCNLDSCTVGLCNGDESYCKSFNCMTSSSCSCTLRKENRPFEVLYNGEIYKPDCLIQDTFRVKREVTPPHVVQTTNCSELHMNADEQGLHITGHTLKPYHIKVCKSPFCTSSKIPSLPHTMPLPEDFYFYSGTLKVTVWELPSHRACKKEVYCPSIERCKSIKCTLCKEKLFNYHCFSVIDWTAIFTGVLLTGFCLYLICCLFWFGITLLKMSKWSIAVSRLVLKALFWPVRWLWRGYSLVRTDENVEKGIEENPVFVQPIATRRKPKAKSSVMFVGIISLLGCANACSDYTSVTLSKSDCTIINGKQSCNLNHVLRASVAPVGQETCMLVRDPFSKPIGTLVLTTNSIDLKCNKNTLYHVPKAEHNCVSSSQCYGQPGGLCWGDDSCKNFHSDMNPPGVIVPENSLNWGGCSRTGQSSIFGCFYSTSPCLFWKKLLINPSKETFEVFDCPSWRYHVDIEYKLNLGSSIKTGKIELSPGSKISKEGVKWSLNSITSPPQPILNKCIISNQKESALVECSRQGELTLGKIGEIQCPDPESAKTMKRCFSDPRIIDLQVTDRTHSCYANLVNPNSLLSKNALPFMSEGLEIIDRDNSILAELSGTSSMEIQIESSNLQLTSSYDKVNCFAKFESLEGCYSCLAGAKLNLQAYTDAGETAGEVSCKGGLKFPLLLDSKPKTRSHIIHLDTGKVQEDCTLTCPGNEVPFSIKGQLFYDEATDFRNVSHVVGVNPNSTLGTWSFEWPSLNPVSNLFSFSSILLFILGMMFCVWISIKLLVKFKPL